jgi:hypothetical protein
MESKLRRAKRRLLSARDIGRCLWIGTTALLQLGRKTGQACRCRLESAQGAARCSWIETTSFLQLPPTAVRRR